MELANGELTGHHLRIRLTLGIGACEHTQTQYQHQYNQQIGFLLHFTLPR